MQNPNSSAQIDETQVKGHFNDNGATTLQKYHARLREYALDEARESVPGD